MSPAPPLCEPGTARGASPVWIVWTCHCVCVCVCVCEWAGGLIECYVYCAHLHMKRYMQKYHMQSTCAANYHQGMLVSELCKA